MESGHSTRKLSAYLLARFRPVVHAELMAELLDDDDPVKLRREVGSECCEEIIPLPPPASQRVAWRNVTARPGPDCGTSTVILVRNFGRKEST